MRALASLEAHSSIAGVPDATVLKQPDLARITLERLLGAPPGTDPSIIAILAGALDKALRDPEVVDWARKSNVPITIETPDQTAQVLHEQVEFFDRWKKYLKPGG
jgi:tripartite-type tricarboxylate transporter receptor subunit TctC